MVPCVHFQRFLGEEGGPIPQTPSLVSKLYYMPGARWPLIPGKVVGRGLAHCKNVENYKTTQLQQVTSHLFVAASSCGGEIAVGVH